ncbi:unnamed protein product [Linum tenue]|uniref:Uncharacterized protein n=1 Tax=Linum tenue TaxID=586396 RepID=A0AAV0Q7I6_9ROSI|nr:unnamed protein product [Linum tenue]
MYIHITWSLVGFVDKVWSIKLMICLEQWRKIHLMQRNSFKRWFLRVSPLMLPQCP